mgnify:CR=1 FL=1
MTSKLKVNLINDAGDNNLITSDGSGSVTLGSAFPASLASGLGGLAPLGLGGVGALVGGGLGLLGLI